MAVVVNGGDGGGNGRWGEEMQPHSATAFCNHATETVVNDIPPSFLTKTYDPSSLNCP